MPLRDQHIVTMPRYIAIDRNILHYFTGKECINKHIDVRYKSGACQKCAILKATKRRKDKPERTRAATNRYAAKNINKSRQRKKLWYSRNLNKATETARQWHADNPEKVKEKRKKWEKENPGKVGLRRAKRRAALLNRTPEWIDHELIFLMYKACALLQEFMEKEYHVDHVLPLQGQIVSGLHVHTNLQILTKTENLSKGNRI